MFESKVVFSFLGNAKLRHGALPIVAASTCLAIGFGFVSTALGGAGHGDHGSAKVSVNVTGTSAIVDLEISSEDAYGLEKAPNSPEEKQRAQTAVETVSKNIASMIVFDPSLGCEWKQRTIEAWKVHETNAKNQHGELHATWDVTCKTKLEGSRLKFGVKKHFSSVNSIEVLILRDSKKTNHTIKRDRGVVPL